MTSGAVGYLQLAAAVSLESVAQLLMKLGSDTAQRIQVPSPAAGSLTTRSRRPPWIYLAVTTYLLEVLLYSLALQHLKLSVAFPCGSLCFVGVALLSRIFLGESVSLGRWLGIGLIVGGVSLVAA